MEICYGQFYRIFSSDRRGWDDLCRSDDGCLYAIGQAPLTQVTFTASPPAPASCGTPVTVLAAASGGTNVAFQFWVYNPAATPAWSELQGYSNLDSCTWTPTAVGDYLLSVTARDGVSGAEVNTTAWYTVIYPPLTAVSVTPSPASPQSSNTPITLTAAATGGTNVQYQFWPITRRRTRHGASCRPIPR